MAGFVVSIVTGKDEQSSSVKVDGLVQHTITSDERGTFNVRDANLKAAIGKSFGKAPNDAYLHSPTPWGDLYTTYNWPQTQTVVRAISAEILGITSEPVILKNQIFENISSKEVTYDVSISDSITNTSTSTWSTGGTLTVGQKVTYNVEFLGTGVGGETSMSYSQSWGIGGTSTKSTTIGSSAGMKVTLQPGEKVVVELGASRGVMKVRVRYEARLVGGAAINYNPTYKGHHFWCLDTPSIMSNTGISNSIISTDNLSIGYYSNGKITVRDADTMQAKESIDWLSPQYSDPGPSSGYVE